MTSVSVIFTMMLGITAVACTSKDAPDKMAGNGRDAGGTAVPAATAQSPAPVPADSLVPATYTVYDFPTSNSSPAQFSFANVHDPFALGPSAIALSDSFAFIVDRFHGNLKKVNLYTGQMTASAKMAFPKAPPISDLALANGQLYLSNTSDTLYVLSQDMVRTGAIGIGDKYFRTEQYFLPGNSGKASLFCRAVNDVLTVDPHGKVAALRADDDLSTKRYDDRFQLPVNSVNGKDIARVDGRSFALREHVPDIPEYHPAYFTWDTRHFAYFGYTGKTLRLHVYTFGA